MKSFLPKASVSARSRSISAKSYCTHARLERLPIVDYLRAVDIVAFEERLGGGKIAVAGIEEVHRGGRRTAAHQCSNG